MAFMNQGLVDGYLEGEDWSDDWRGVDQWGNYVVGHDERGDPIINNNLSAEEKAEIEAAIAAEGWG